MLRQTRLSLTLCGKGVSQCVLHRDNYHGAERSSNCLRALLPVTMAAVVVSFPAVITPTMATPASMVVGLVQGSPG
jgi:hypothetical protein